ncbi:MAG: class I SAM-dependent methyltransferase [Acidobacteria bacterium]|nr:class I SAM-dependent methyltransferase [Acidobacteriota bacterium]
MDKYQVTTDTFNRLAQRYQDKYMDLDLYDDTYDLFCRCIDKERAEVLDVACGPGNITRYLLAQRPQFKLQGIDLAPNMIELARRNNPTAEFRVLDGRQIAALGERFDAIICGFYLPYLSQADAAQFIRDASACLQPQGVLYLSGMEGDDRQSGFQESSAGDKVYLHYHDTRLMSETLAAEGFEILDVRYQDSPAQSTLLTRDFFLIAKLHH